MALSTQITPYIRAVRAISAEFARRLYMPIVITVASMLVVLLALTVWLITISAWWWLLMVLLIIATVVFAVIATIAGVVITLFTPNQSKVQKQSVKKFVDKLQEVAETLQTPKFILMVRLIKDVAVPSDAGMVTQLTSHVSSVRPDFQAIVDSFK